MVGASFETRLTALLRMRRFLNAIASTILILDNE